MAPTTPQGFRGKKEHRGIIIVITLSTFYMPDTCIVSFNLSIDPRDKYHYYIHFAQEESETSEGLRTLPQVTHLGNVPVLLFGTKQLDPRAHHALKALWSTQMAIRERKLSPELMVEEGGCGPFSFCVWKQALHYNKQEGDSDNRQTKKVKTNKQKHVSTVQ